MLSQAVLADALANQQKFEAAQNLLSHLRPFSQAADIDIRLRAAIALARANAISRSAASNSSLRILKEVVADATLHGFLNDAFQARLALGEVEMNAGDRGTAMRELKSLSHEAEARGFLNVARKARVAGRLQVESSSLKALDALKPITVHYLRGQVLQRMGQREKARAEFDAYTQMMNTAREKRGRELSGEIPNPELMKEPE